MNFWKIEELRLVQQRANASNINAESVEVGNPGPPAGKLWIILAAAYMPDAAETQNVSWEKRTASGLYLTLLNPVSLSLNPARCTFIEQGMEFFLLPGEYLIARREDHTVGSLMSAWIQFIEIDLPLYTYEEPQIVKREKRAISSLRQMLGGGGGRPTIGGSPPLGPGSRLPPAA